MKKILLIFTFILASCYMTKHDNRFRNIEKYSNHGRHRLDFEKEIQTKNYYLEIFYCIEENCNFRDTFLLKK